MSASVLNDRKPSLGHSVKTPRKALQMQKVHILQRNPRNPPLDFAMTLLKQVACGLNVSVLKLTRSNLGTMDSREVKYSDGILLLENCT